MAKPMKMQLARSAPSCISADSSNRGTMPSGQLTAAPHHPWLLTAVADILPRGSGPPHALSSLPVLHLTHGWPCCPPPALQPTDPLCISRMQPCVPDHLLLPANAHPHVAGTAPAPLYKSPPLLTAMPHVPCLSAHLLLLANVDLDIRLALLVHDVI
jgi:hypothetical protein